MATLTASSTLPAAAGDRPAASARYDWAMILAASCMGSGAYIDGWAHNHALATGGAIETFFTPWHALLYGGYGLVALSLLGTLLFWHARGFTWRDAVPRGYGLSVVGVCIFALGGMLDMFWHLLFGIEVSTEALLSPTHIMLVVGAVLIYMGPARSVIARNPEPRSWAENGPLVLSLVWLLSSFTFFSQYASPYASTLASTIRKPANPDWIDLFVALGVAGVALQAAFLSGVFLYALKLGRIPFGTFAAIAGLNVLAMTAMRMDLLTVSPVILTLGAIVAGLAVDALYVRLQPATEGGMALRAFAFCAPAIVYAVYFGIIAATGSYWTIHLLSGCVVTAGLVGLLMSFLISDPPCPALR